MMIKYLVIHTLYLQQRGSNVVPTSTAEVNHAVMLFLLLVIEYLGVTIA